MGLELGGSSFIPEVFHFGPAEGGVPGKYCRRDEPKPRCWALRCVELVKDWVKFGELILFTGASHCNVQEFFVKGLPGL